MKRMHVNLKVRDLHESIDFYTALFGTQPTVRKADYAKWMLEDPRLNFSIVPGRDAGIEHLGIQAEDEAELSDLFTGVDRARGPVLREGNTVCCYAQSNKAWIEDPQGVSWEMFHTYGESDTFRAEAAPTEATADCCSPSCCTPEEAAAEAAV